MSRFPRHLLIAGLFVQRELLEKPYSDNGWQYALCAGLSMSGINALEGAAEFTLAARHFNRNDRAMIKIISGGQSGVDRGALEAAL